MHQTRGGYFRDFAHQYISEYRKRTLMPQQIWIWAKARTIIGHINRRRRPPIHVWSIPPSDLSIVLRCVSPVVPFSSLRPFLFKLKKSCLRPFPLERERRGEMHARFSSFPPLSFALFPRSLVNISCLNQISDDR